jgi:DNA helicase-2/ATP-dependent DNA helicase PcrA
MLDLEDLQFETLRLFRQHPEICSRYARRYPKIFVDEYQDTSPLQVEILKSMVLADPFREKRASLFSALSDPGTSGLGPVVPEVCAIGDPDQAIYGFRGADCSSFHRFPEDFPGATVITLSTNYRSTGVILEAAAAIVRKDKPLRGTLDRGDPILIGSCGTGAEEAEMIVEQIEKIIGGTSYFSLDSDRVSSTDEGQNISFADIAVLFRLNAQGDTLEEALSRTGIPLIRSGEKPLVYRYPVNMIWRFFQALCAPDHPYYLNAYLAFPDAKAHAGKKRLEGFELEGSIPDLIDRAIGLHELDQASEAMCEDLQRLKDMGEVFRGDMPAFLDALTLDRGIDHAGLRGDRVALMSLHAAKGLEWPVVFITGCEDGLIPCSLFGGRDDEEERRLIYVGMTRARSRLILAHASRRNLNGRILNQTPSPFLQHLPAGLRSPLERSGWKRKRKAHKQLDLFSKP